MVLCIIEILHDVFYHHFYETNNVKSNYAASKLKNVLFTESYERFSAYKKQTIIEL